MALCLVKSAESTLVAMSRLAVLNATDATSGQAGALRKPREARPPMPFEMMHGAALKL
jgi:hypothetical protein